MYKFDVLRFLRDCGGISSAAARVGKERTAGYGWVQRGRMNSDDIATLKGQNPNLDLNSYVIVESNKPND